VNRWRCREMREVLLLGLRLARRGTDCNQRKADE
jgi:hypothetical protein